MTAKGREVEQTVRNTIREIKADWAERMGNEEYQRLLQVLRELIVVIGE